MRQKIGNKKPYVIYLLLFLFSFNFVSAKITAGETLDCTLIIGGTDSDFCIDSAGSGGISWAEALNGSLMQTANWNSTNTSYFDLNKANSVGAFNQTFDASTLFINANNNRIGIGTVSPGTKLEVATGNSEYLPSTSAFSIQKNEEGYGLFAGVSGSGNGWLQAGTANDATNYNLILQSRGGNVGIGTTAPKFQTEINGVGQDTAAITDAGAKAGTLSIIGNANNAGSGGALLFGSANSVTASSVGGAAIKYLLTNGVNNTAGDLAFSTRNAATDTALTERMRILSGGNVGIGTTTPAYFFQVGNGSATNYSLVSAYFEGNISSAGYITRTSVYDKTQGSALNFIKDASTLTTAGKVNDSKFYGYTTWTTKETDYSKPVTKEENICYSGTVGEEVCKLEMVTKYPYQIDIKHEGVSLDKEIDVLRQAVYELKVKDEAQQIQINEMQVELCKIGVLKYC